LSYSLRYAQSAHFGEQGNGQSISPSASLAYSTGHRRHPFRLDYGGGYTWQQEGNNYGAGYFQRFLIAQSFTGPGWDVEVSDDVGYRHQAPLTGFSGVAGTGEPITNLPTAPLSSSDAVLTLDTRQINNVVQGDLSKLLSHSMSLQVGSSYSILSYPDGNNIDNRGLVTDAGMQFRLSARHDVNSSYMHSRFSYPDSGATISVDTLTFGYHRAWTRAISSEVSAGPEWVRSSSSSAQPGPAWQVPPSTDISAQADLSYANRFRSAGLSYRRGVASGGGYFSGGKTDQVTGSFSEIFARKLTLELVCGYRRMSELTSQNTLTSEIGSVQASWRLGKHADLYASYTAASQGSNSSLPGNMLSSLYQVVSFGIGYTRQINRSH
jgi:hypothetical protein